MTDIIASVKEALELRKERDRQLLELLEAKDELTLVLRAHLVLEELLYSAISAHCQDPSQLFKAKLRFPQLIALLRALDKFPSMPPKAWIALEKLNAIRNRIAHTLEPNEISLQIEQFITSLEIDLPADLQDQGHDPLKLSLGYLIGMLSASSAAQVVLEKMIVHQISKTADAR